MHARMVHIMLCRDEAFQAKSEAEKEVARAAFLMEEQRLAHVVSWRLTSIHLFTYSPK
jgi:hypothetical protein